MSRPKWALVWLLSVLLAFGGGFGPEWWEMRKVETRVDSIGRELDLSRVENRIGSAFADAGHGNYERARRTMTLVFTTLQARIGSIEDSAARAQLQAVLDQRDSIITSLSRAEPDSAAKLLAVFARCQVALDPEDGHAAGFPSLASPSSSNAGGLP